MKLVAATYTPLAKDTMKSTTDGHSALPPMLTGWNVENQIQLIIGANSLAAARCAKSLEVGARPIVIAPETDDLHFTLADHIANGKAQWVRREFQDEDLTTLGREEVDRVVDTVFVTLGGNHETSKLL